MPNESLFADDQLFVDPNKDYYSELVGEDKKYKSNQDLAYSRVEADAYIARLEREQEGLRGELATRIKYEDFMTKLESLKLDNEDRDNLDTEPTTDTSAMKPEELERLLEQKLNQRDQQKTAQQNLNIAKAKLAEAFGPNYVQHLRRQAEELDMSPQTLEQMAASNPKALFKLLGIGSVSPQETLFETPPKTQVMSGGSSSKVARGDSYYEELRKKDPVAFFSPKIQNERMDRIKEIGVEKFLNS